MIDSGDYMLAWQVYMGCGVAATLFWGLLLRVYRFGAFRFWLFLSVACLVLTPWHHPDVQGIWVPALLGALLTIMTDGVESALPALIIIGGGQLAALAIAIAAAIMVPSAAKASAQGSDEGSTPSPEAKSSASVNASTKAKKAPAKTESRIEPKFTPPA